MAATGSSTLASWPRRHEEIVNLLADDFAVLGAGEHAQDERPTFGQPMLGRPGPRLD
jgi:hypothetical protein